MQRISRMEALTRRRARRKLFVRLAVVLALVVPTAVISVGTGAGAVDPTNAFELDGNILPVTKVDWQNTNTTTPTGLFNTTAGVASAANPLPAGFSQASFVRDFTAGSTKDFTTFTNGSDDTSDVAGRSCDGVNNVTDKGDINKTYASA
jgi:hypothetical protein